MTLAVPLAVGFSVASGQPVDTADWITVALDAFIDQRSRGIIVATEPIGADGRSHELARLARELLLAELRMMDDLPPDEAIGRAFAAANGMLFDEGQPGAAGGYDRKVLVGATAVLIDGHRCTIGHVPPGQITLVEDGLAYAVPDLPTWLPDFTLPPDAVAPPEPLGYTSWTAPLLVQTDLSDGDAVLICSASLAESWAIELAEAGLRVADLARFYGRSPDTALDVFRGLLIGQTITDGSALVLAFPPRPGSFGVVTWGDVGWKLGERRRRVRGHVRRLLPARVATAMGVPRPAPRRDDRDGRDDDDAPTAGAAVRSRWTGAASRLRRRGDGADTWNAPKQVREFGVPRTHGVQVHRTASVDRGESGWRTAMPRLPVSGLILSAMLVVMLALLGAGVWALRDRFQDPPADVSATLAQVDQNILAAGGSTDPEDRRALLALASETLDVAEQEGALAADVAPRSAAITEATDELDQVIRLEGLTRVGSLPEELRGGRTRAQFTPGGLFLVNGSLFQLRSEERQIARILTEGETIGEAEVGDLFGMALDGEAFLTTDGSHVFRQPADGQWSAVTMADINELGAWEPGPVGAFGGSLYLLETEYRNIYRFSTETDDGVAEPVDWVLAPVRPDLVNAVDMAIDTSIYVILDDGEMLTYLQGDLDERVFVPYTADGAPQSIVIGPGTQLMYIALRDDAEGEEGWIVVFDPSSGQAWQLRLPAGFSADEVDVSAPFDGLQDVAIDEASGTVYIVNEDAVWTAQYSLPVSVTAGTPTPEPQEGEGG